MPENVGEHVQLQHDHRSEYLATASATQFRLLLGYGHSGKQGFERCDNIGFDAKLNFHPVRYSCRPPELGLLQKSRIPPLRPRFGRGMRTSIASPSLWQILLAGRSEENGKAVLSTKDTKGTQRKNGFRDLRFTPT